MDSKRPILILQGSFRKESLASKIVGGFDEHKPKGVEFLFPDIENFPIFNQDLEFPEPEFLLGFKKQIKLAKGVLIVTPEYNRSIPPVLKNALDWASRPQVPYDQRVWNAKPTAIAGYSLYSLGGFGVVHHLRQVLAFLNMPTMQQPEFYLNNAGDRFDETGKLVDQDTIEHIKKFWTAFMAFIDVWS